MAMNIAITAIVAMIAYWWSGQGFFSSLLHFACVLAAGAIAFAAWEPFVEFGFSRSSSPLMHDIAWGVALMLVFGLSLPLLKMVTEKACPANIDFSHLVNLVGGGIFGILSGIVTGGILLIGLQFIQGPTPLLPVTENLGYVGWTLGEDAQITRNTKLWVPVDELTARYYSEASRGSMFVINSLAEWHPNLDVQASLYRQSYGDGGSHMGMKAGQIEVTDAVRLAVDQEWQRMLPECVPSEYKSGDVYVLHTSINNSAWDGGDKLRLSRAQVRLVVYDQDVDAFVAVHPHAYYQISRTDDPTEGRFEFVTTDDYATSVGAGSETRIRFEFIVPTGAELHHLIVRQTRAHIPDTIRSVSFTDYTQGLDRAPAALSTGTAPKISAWQGYMLSFLLFGLILFVNLRASKRSHQD